MLKCMFNKTNTLKSGSSAIINLQLLMNFDYQGNPSDLIRLFPSRTSNNNTQNCKVASIFFFLLSPTAMNSKRLEALLNNLTLAETSNRGSSTKLERDLGQIALESNILKAKLNNDQGLSATA